jgi:hypothetical protein
VNRIALAAAAVLLAACIAPVQVKVGDWTASCIGVSQTDCEGIASLFINNLARSWKSVFDESGGRVSVEPRPDCPAIPEWADGSFCWEAEARVSTGAVCMVVARQMDPVKAGAGFGQVGGDEMTGRAGGPPEGWPTCE